MASKEFGYRAPSELDTPVASGIQNSLRLETDESMSGNRATIKRIICSFDPNHLNSAYCNDKGVLEETPLSNHLLIDESGLCRGWQFCHPSTMNRGPKRTQKVSPGQSFPYGVFHAANSLVGMLEMRLTVYSQFGMFETMISAFLDEYPALKKHKILFKAILCFLMFLLGLPCTTEGGMYILQLMDWYSAAFSLMVISLLELICISFVYGIDRFFTDISLMIKRTPPFWWKLCWCYITPGTIIGLLLFIAINHEAVTYNEYIYPEWSIVVGWMIAMCSIVPIPTVAIYQLLKAEGTLKERFIASLQPTEEWGPALEEHRILYKKSLALVPSRFPPNREPIAIPAASAEQGNADEGLRMVRVDDALLTAESAI
ncbi:sodium- and chloride-dependent glycine transporter 2 [Trichonephila clavipes]|nr:sodium- and chloride-dependent glycine transporter 2 [Trichonephila clavipes]